MVSILLLPIVLMVMVFRLVFDIVFAVTVIMFQLFVFMVGLCLLPFVVLFGYSDKDYQ